METIWRALNEAPVIAAVRSEKETEEAAASPVRAVFLLQTSLFSLRRQSEALRKAEKHFFVHFDMIEGLGRDRCALQFLAETIRPDGIISTRTQTVRQAAELGIFTVQRFFMVDSKSYETMVRSLAQTAPDMVEIMPGVVPQLIKKFAETVKIPVIAGGLVSTKDDVFRALSAGASAVSVGKQELWSV